MHLKWCTSRNALQDSVVVNSDFSLIALCLRRIGTFCCVPAFSLDWVDPEKCVKERSCPVSNTDEECSYTVVWGGEEEAETRHAQKFRIFCNEFSCIFQIKFNRSLFKSSFFDFLWQDAASVLRLSPGSPAYWWFIAIWFSMHDYDLPYWLHTRILS